MKSILVVGAQWGDQGKGKVADYMAESYAYMARCASSPVSIRLNRQRTHTYTFFYSSLSMRVLMVFFDPPVSSCCCALVF
jgi:hypothetical protein